VWLAEGVNRCDSEWHFEGFAGYMIAMGYKTGWLCVCEYCGPGG